MERPPEVDPLLRAIGRAIWLDGPCSNPEAEHLRLAGLGSLLAYLNTGTGSEPELHRTMQRRALLMARSQGIEEALNAVQLRHAFLGSLAAPSELQPHLIWKDSQDIDLLVEPQTEPAVRRILAALGWLPYGGWGLLKRDDVLLDLHLHVGEESRFSVLASILPASTNAVFNQWRGLDHGLPLALFAHLRVMHFFKHYACDPAHGAELLLLFKHADRSAKDWQALPLNLAQRRIWAFVMAVLSTWTGQPLEEVVTTDRNWLKQRGIQRVLHLVLTQQQPSAAFRLNFCLLGPVGRLRLLMQLLFPSRRQLARIYGLDGSLAMGEVFGLRLKRLRKLVSHAFGRT